MSTEEVKEGEIVSRSPVPTKKPEQHTMGFSEAMKEVIAKKKITRLEWNNHAVYGFLNVDVLSLRKEDGKDYQWIISEGDLLGTDWIVVN